MEKVFEINSTEFVVSISFFSTDNKEPMPLPPAPYISDFDPLRSESNEEFTTRLKNMGKSKRLKINEYVENLIILFIDSMDKFNQLARRFSMRKDSTVNVGKYSKQPM